MSAKEAFKNFLDNHSPEKSEEQFRQILLDANLDTIKEIEEALMRVTFLRLVWEIEPDQVPQHMRIGKLINLVTDSLMKANESDEDHQKVLQTWMSFQSQHIHELNVLRENRDNNIEIEALLDLHLECLNSYAAGLENSALSNQTKRNIQAQHAYLAGAYERPVPVYNTDIAVEKRQAYIAALIKPVKHIHAYEAGRTDLKEKAGHINQIPYLDITIRRISYVLERLGNVPSFENEDAKVQPSLAHGYDIIYKLGKDNCDSIVHVHYLVDNSGRNIYGNLFDKDGNNAVLPQVEQAFGWQHYTDKIEDIKQLYAENKDHACIGRYVHGPLTDALGLDRNAPSDLHQIRAARAIFGLFWLQDFCDLPLPAPVKKGIPVSV